MKNSITQKTQVKVFLIDWNELKADYHVEKLGHSDEEKNCEWNMQDFWDIIERSNL
jgi:hypothetical protein